MKKKILIIFILAIIILSLVGCGKSPDKDNNTLQAPTNVKIENELITWDKVKKATSYEVIINDEVNIVNTNEFQYPEVLDYIDLIYVKAKSNKKHIKDSPLSKPIFVKQKLSEELIQVKISGYEEMFMPSEQKEFIHETALLLFKYNLTMNDLDLNNRNIRELANKGKLGDLFSYYILISDNLLKQLLPQFSKLPDLTEEEKDLYQQAFDEFKQRGIYQSNETDVFKDDKFINFFLPMICKSINLGAVIGNDNDYNLMINIAQNGRFNVDIRKTENGFNIYDKNREANYEITFEELKKLREDKVIDINNANKYSPLYLTSLERYIYNNKKNYREKTLKRFEESEVQLFITLQENKELINDLLVNIYNSSKKMEDLQEAITNVQNKINEATTPDKKLEAIYELKGLIEQFFVLQEKFPSSKELKKILDILIDSSALDYYLSSTIGEFVSLRSETRQILKNLCEDLFFAYDESIKIGNNKIRSNLDMIFNYILHPEIKDNEENFKQLVQEIQEEFNASNIEENFDISNVLNLALNLVKITQSKNIKSIIGIMTGIELNEELSTQLKIIIKDFINYFSKFDFTKLKEIILNKDIINNQNIVLTDEEKIEISKFLFYLADYATEFDLNEYKAIIENIVLFHFNLNRKPLPDGITVSEVGQFIIDNRQELIDYNILQLAPTLFERFEKDRFGFVISKNEDIINNLKSCYDFIKLRVTPEKAAKLAATFKRMNEITPNDKFKKLEEFYTGDINKKFEKIYSLIGKLESKLTNEEKEFINKLPYGWNFPKELEMSYDYETNEFVLKFYDEEMKNTSYTYSKHDNKIQLTIVGSMYDIDFVTEVNKDGEIFRIDGKQLIDIVITSHFGLFTYKDFVNSNYNYVKLIIQNGVKININNEEKIFEIEEFNLVPYMETLYNLK